MPEPWVGEILKFSDGDTVFVSRNDVAVKVRIRYIDSPEISRRKKVSSQPFALEAKDYATTTWKGSKVRVIPSGMSYDRVIGVVLTDADEVSIGLSMVSQGYATLDSRYHPPKEYKAAEEQAKKDHLGLWTQEKPVMPWEWRKKQKSRSESN